MSARCRTNRGFEALRHRAATATSAKRLPPAPAIRNRRGCHRCAFVHRCGQPRVHRAWEVPRPFQACLLSAAHRRHLCLATLAWPGGPRGTPIAGTGSEGFLQIPTVAPRVRRSYRPWSPVPRRTSHLVRTPPSSRAGAHRRQTQQPIDHGRSPGAYPVDVAAAGNLAPVRRSSYPTTPSFPPTDAISSPPRKTTTSSPSSTSPPERSCGATDTQACPAPAGYVWNPDDAMILPDGAVISADIKNCRHIRVPPLGWTFPGSGNGRLLYSQPPDTVRQP